MVKTSEQSVVAATIIGKGLMADHDKVGFHVDQNIAMLIKFLKNHFDFTGEHLAAEKRAAEEKLASERKFNELYSQVQTLFAKEEAETYKQGQQMVVRLRGMSFPVGQALAHYA